MPLFYIMVLPLIQYNHKWDQYVDRWICWEYLRMWELCGDHIALLQIMQNKIPYWMFLALDISLFIKVYLSIKLDKYSEKDWVFYKKLN